MSIFLYVCVPRVYSAQREGAKSFLTKGTDCCDPPGGCWESNLSLLQEKQTAELSLQPHPFKLFFFL